jgi:hypothetical protein
MRGAMPDATGVPDDLAELVAHELAERGLTDEPIGVDVPDMTTTLALQRKGIHLADSQPVMLEARKIRARTSSRCSTRPPGSSTRSTRRSTRCCARG